MILRHVAALAVNVTRQLILQDILNFQVVLQLRGMVRDMKRMGLTAAEAMSLIGKLYEEESE